MDLLILFFLLYWKPLWLYLNLLFGTLVFCTNLTRKYWCKCTNMQYCEVKPAADAYVTLLYVVLNSLTRWHSIWIHLYYPFCYIGNLWSVSAEWTNFFHRGRYLERRKKLKTVNDIKACNKTTAKHYIIILINKKKLAINITNVSYTCLHRASLKAITEVCLQNVKSSINICRNLERSKVWKYSKWHQNLQQGNSKTLYNNSYK